MRSMFRRCYDPATRSSCLSTSLSRSKRRLFTLTNGPRVPPRGIPVGIPCRASSSSCKLPTGSTSYTYAFQRYHSCSAKIICNNRPTLLGQRQQARCFQTKISLTFTDQDDDGRVDPNVVNPNLVPYIKSSLNAARKGNIRILSADTDDVTSDFVVSFLGTGSGGVQSVDRLSSATVLRLGGQAFLFDAGEGLQRQIAFSRVKPLDISNIFITHLHGDHVYGLAGLLLTMQESASSSIDDSGRNTLNERPIVNIYGPSGTYNFIAMMLALSFAQIRSISVMVYELVGGEHDGGIMRTHRGSNMDIDTTRDEGGSGSKKGRGPPRHQGRNVFLHRYDEIKTPGLQRRRIEKNGDGYWTLHHPVQSTDVDVERRGRDKEFQVHAGEVAHLPGVQTFGYVVEELIPQRNIDPKKATALGVSPGRKYRDLKKGIPVVSDDGTKTIDPEDVLFDHVEPRKFALIGDNCAVPPEMARLCQDADVLVHEATLSDDEVKATSRGHATASMAGALAKTIHARTLLMNHIGSALSYNDAKDITDKAMESNEGASQIQVACDFMEVVVPKGGFRFD